MKILMKKVGELLWEWKHYKLWIIAISITFPLTKTILPSFLIINIDLNRLQREKCLWISFGLPHLLLLWKKRVGEEKEKMGRTIKSKRKKTNKWKKKASSIKINKFTMNSLPEIRTIIIILKKLRCWYRKNWQPTLQFLIKATKNTLKIQNSFIGCGNLQRRMIWYKKKWGTEMGLMNYINKNNH